MAHLTLVKTNSVEDEVGNSYERNIFRLSEEASAKVRSLLSIKGNSMKRVMDTPAAHQLIEKLINKSVDRMEFKRGKNRSNRFYIRTTSQL